ncbi:DUF1343 domain-containing protein [Colwellia sp. D2M02]|nr:DUF1343 domain-containing protein [Colwellia sp. D2M02]
MIFLRNILVALLMCFAVQACHVAPLEKPQKLVVGAEQPALYLPKLAGKRVGLVVNQTSKVNNQHLVDFLLAQGINVQVIFAPEHGFRGDHDAGEKFNNSIDKQTGVPLVSIYGKSKKPAAEVMASVDIIVFDIQDVGVRYYTYISSMHYMMAAASEANIGFMVLDRPNPNGMYIDGPVLEHEFQSFVGMHAIPLLHGLTVGELAKMIVGQGWLNTDKPLALTVIPIANYHHQMPYSLPIKPSPNLPNDLAIALYPSLGFFEATPISIGRGTPYPFQVIGYNKTSLGDYTFMPVSTPGAAIKPKLMNETLIGQRFYQNAQTNHGGLTLRYVIQWHQAFAQQHETFFQHPKFMDKLAGTDKLRKAIIAGQTESEIKASWQPALTEYKALRQQYLLYN